MLMFFASIGLSADFSRLKAGGTPLLIFTIVASRFYRLARCRWCGHGKRVGTYSLLGLVTGSIALTGGHGTAGVLGITLEQDYGVVGALVSRYCRCHLWLSRWWYHWWSCCPSPDSKAGVKASTPANPNPSDIEKVAGAQSLYSTKHDEDSASSNKEIFERPDSMRFITASSTIETLALFAAALAFADVMTLVAQGTWFELPTFVWALAGGVIIRNVLTTIFNFDMFDRSIYVLVTLL